MTRNISLRSIIKGDGVFNGMNFPDWDLALRIVLGQEKLLYVLDNPIPPEPSRDDVALWESWRKLHDDNIQAQAIMLAGMNPTYRRQNKGYTAYEMMARLQDLHASSVRAERYEISKKLFRSRM